MAPRDSKQEPFSEQTVNLTLLHPIPFSFSLSVIPGHDQVQAMVWKPCMETAFAFLCVIGVQRGEGWRYHTLQRGTTLQPLIHPKELCSQISHAPCATLCLQRITTLL